MTNTFTPSPPPDPAQEAVNNLEATVQAAPDMQSAPGAALDVATAGGDVQGSAQAVSAAGNRTVRAAAADSVNKASGGGLFGLIGSLGHDVLHIGEDVVGDTIKAVSAPLSMVQHEWRYLHDVEARHGFLAALAEGLVITGAAAAGAVLTAGVGDVAEAGVLGAAGVTGEAAGAEGAAAGAAGAAEGAGASEGAAAAAGQGAGEAGGVAAQSAGRGLLRGGFHIAGKVLNIAAPARVVIPGELAGLGMAQVMYRDSWNRTANSQYKDPHTGELVNFGNDVAGWLGIHRGPYKTGMSAAANAIFDLALDPVASVGKMVGEARSATGLKIGGRFIAPRTYSRAWTAENIDRLAADNTTLQGRAFNRAAEWMANANAGDIVGYDRRLSSLVQPLADAHTKDDVIDVLRNHVATLETTHSSVLPSMSISRLKMAQLRTYMNDGRSSYTSLIGRKQTSTYLHPIRSALLHPRAALGKLTTRVPGTAFDQASRRFLNTTVNLANPSQFAPLLRDYYEMGLSRTQANSIVDLMVHSDVATRQIVHRNAQIMMLLGHAGMDFGNAPWTDAEWFKNTLDNALQHVNDTKFREHIQRRIDSLMQPASPDASGVYAGTMSGEGPRPFVDVDTGKTYQAAVLRSQTGDVPLISYSEVHRMAQSLHGGMIFTGKMDDFLMKHVTDPIFKRWILMSLGYAEHIAAAEAIPNTFRLGFTTMARASYYTALAHLGMAAERNPEELRGITALAYDLLEGNKAKVPLWRRSLMGPLKGFQAAKHGSAESLYRLAPKASAEMTKVMAWIKVTDGNLTTTGLAPHGGLIDSHGDDAVGKAVGSLRGLFARMKLTRGDNYTRYGPLDEEHLRAWRDWLALQSRNPDSVAAARAAHTAYANGADFDEAYGAAQDAAHRSLQSMPQAELDNFVGSRLKREGDPESMTPLESWSHVVAQDVFASTHSSDADVNMKLLKNVADGNATHRSVLYGVPLDERPVGVPGREMIQAGSSPFARIASIGYQRVLNPIVSKLSREPLAYAEFSKRVDQYQHLADQGLLLQEEVYNKAASEATIDAIRYVHNVQDRTQLDQLLRNWVPFFFAQEQAYRRMGRLLVEDPGAFRRYMLAIQSTHNIVANTQDSAGNRYFAFPGSGFLDHLTVGAFGLMGMPTASINPTGFGGTLSAANVIFPGSNGFRPDISPVVTLAAQQVSHFFEEFGQKYSEFQPVATAATGAITDAVGTQAMSQNILQQLIPNTTMYRAVETIAGDDTSFTSAMLMTLQNLAYQQNVAMRKWYADGEKGPMPSIIPPSDASPQRIQAFLARVKNQTRIVFGMRALLGAVSPVSADVMVNDFGLNAKLQADITKTGSLSLGFQKFLRDNPDATPYVVSKSQTATGASLPDTQGALDWVSQNQGLLKRYQYGGMWLMPRLTDTKYSPQAYLEEIANGMRQRRTPEQFLDAVYAENGDQIYYNALAQHEAALQGGGDKTAEYAKWDAYVQNLQAQQPIWWSQFNSGQRQSDAVRSINELNEIYARGVEPDTQQSRDVGALLTAFQQAEQAYMQAGQQSDYSTAQKQVRDQWIAYATQLAQENPNLQSVISSVFRNGLTYFNQT